MRKELFLLFIALLFTSCYQYENDFWPTDSWRTGTPESVGIPSHRITNVIGKIIAEKNVHLHSLLIIRNGVLVTELYIPPHSADTRQNLHSATKSFTSTLTGIAAKKNLLDVDDPLLSYFPDWEIERRNDLKEQITIEHLLTQSSGFNWTDFQFSYDPRNPLPFYEMYHAENAGLFVLNRAVITKPGTSFLYNSGNSHLLNVVLDQVIDQPVEKFAEENLFEPLGITDYVWPEDPQGIPIGGVSLHLRPRDMAKLGYLYLHQGNWEGRQIISRNWVETATTSHLPAPERNNSYGYQWWVYNGFYAAEGAGGQFIIVLPELDTVVVLTQNSPDAPYTPCSILFNDLYPYIYPDLSLPENPEEYEKLQLLLDELSTEKVNRQEIPQDFQNIVGQEFSFDQRTYLESLKIEEIRPDEMDMVFRYKNPVLDKVETAEYTVGLDNRYRMNPLKSLTLSTDYFFQDYHYLYPDPEEYRIALKGTFNDDDSLTLNYPVLGSIRMDCRMTIVVENGKLHILDTLFTKNRNREIVGRPAE